MNGLEERVAKLEGTVSQMNERLNHLGREISELRAEIRSNFRWMLGILIPMWVTIIGTFVGLFLTLVK